MSIHQIIKQRLSLSCLIHSQTFSSDPIWRLTNVFAKTMNLIRLDKSAACNAIWVTLLHVLVDLVDGCTDGFLSTGEVDFRKQRSLLFCLASDRSAQEATSWHAPCLCPSTKLTYSWLRAQILPHRQWCRRTHLWLCCTPCRHSVSMAHWLLAPAGALLFCCSCLLHFAKISSTFLQNDIKTIYGGGKMMAGPKRPRWLLDFTWTADHLLTEQNSITQSLEWI